MLYLCVTNIEEVIGMARKNFTTTIDETMLKELKKLAIDLDMDAGRLIEFLVQDYLKRREKEQIPQE